jgi:hypothetical protein
MYPYHKGFIRKWMLPMQRPAKVDNKVNQNLFLMIRIVRFGMFEYLLMQVFDIKEAAVFIPLGFGLLVGLVYAIISSIRRKD